MQDRATEQELDERLSLIESMIRRGAPEHRELGMDIRSVRCCVLSRHRLVRVGSPRVGLAGHYPDRSDYYCCRCFLEDWQASGDHPGPGNRFYLDCLGNFVVSALSSTRPEWETDRSTSFCGRDIGHTWHGQRSLGPDSSLEGSVRVRSRVEGGCCGYMLGTDAQSMIVFLVAIFLRQIEFGIYGMVSEAQERKRRGPIHA
jgi:hypothetical protein